MPEIRYDGTAPILFTPKTFTVLEDDRDQFLCLSLFNRSLANKHALPNTLTLRIPEREQNVATVINTESVPDKGCILFSKTRSEGEYLVIFNPSLLAGEEEM